MSSNGWQFQSEATLEDFVWSQLDALLGFQSLARQHCLQHQVCDILAVTSARQLVILELKNTEDRYVVQQLTRYYDAVLTEKPFADQVDYSLPVRLVALAPQFHTHNLIDQQYHRLTLELWMFEIIQDRGEFYFQWRSSKSVHRSAIPSHFHRYLIEKQILVSEATVILQNTRPPKSLQTLIEGLPELKQRNAVLAVRDRILTFDKRMAEIGRTTTTSYGLRKGKNDLFKGKLCAEFVSLKLNSSYRLRLMLYLPYPKRELGGPGRTYLSEKVKGFTWAEAMYRSEWDTSSALEIYFFLGKSRSSYSFTCNLTQYEDIYNKLTGHNQKINSMDDLLDLALEEWRQQVELPSS